MSDFVGVVVQLSSLLVEAVRRATREGDCFLQERKRRGETSRRTWLSINSIYQRYTPQSLTQHYKSYT